MAKTKTEDTPLMQQHRAIKQKYPDAPLVIGVNETHLLIDGYLIAHGCESIRERLRHVCSPPGADDLEGVRPIFKRVPDDKRSLVSVLEETSIDGLARSRLSASASWTAKRTRLRCSLVSALRAAATFLALGSNA